MKCVLPKTTESLQITAFPNNNRIRIQMCLSKNSNKTCGFRCFVLNHICFISILFWGKHVVYKDSAVFWGTPHVRKKYVGCLFAKMCCFCSRVLLFVFLVFVFGRCCYKKCRATPTSRRAAPI